MAASGHNHAGAAADALRLHDRGIPAGAAGGGGLDGRGIAGPALVPASRRALHQPARRTAAGAGGRARMADRLLARSAARILGGGTRLQRRRRARHRRLSTRANLRRRRVLGDLPARPRHGRQAPRRDGGAADDRHLPPLGADAGVRPTGAGTAAHRRSAAALLARTQRAASRALDRARICAGTAASNHAMGTAAAACNSGIHAGDAARPRRARKHRPLRRRRARARHPLSVFLLADPLRRGLGQPCGSGARARRERERCLVVASAARRVHCGACRVDRAGGAGQRHRGQPRRAGAGNRAPAPARFGDAVRGLSSRWRRR